MKNRVLLLLLLITSGLYAQPDTSELQKIRNYRFYQPSPSDYRNSLVKKDSLPLKNTRFIKKKSKNWEMPESILLDKVVVVAPMRFADRKERIEYLRLERKTKKVWPYAVLAAERLKVLRERLDLLETKREKKKYTIVVQNYMEDQFEEQLRKLTKSEGQILVKLMYRQTGQSTFETVRELRSGWNAFWYNVTANMFTISLKEIYNPLESEEDYHIEHILRRNFQKNTLDYEPPGIEIDYPLVVEKWKE